jgi:peptidoglycan/LPS O-acetylase OafA/YrhL
VQSVRSRDHVDALDGLRSLAACIVLVGHTWVSVAKPAADEVFVRHSPLAILINGWGAVHVFFILSGYCLAGSAERCRRLSDLGQFYVRRIFRIYPPYVFGVLAAWCASFAYDPLQAGLTPFAQRNSAVHLSLAELAPHLLVPGVAGGQLSHGWTLGVELAFAFLLPGMLWLVRRTHWSLLLALTCYPVLNLEREPGVLDYGLFFALGIALYRERERLARWLARPSPWLSLAVVAAGLTLFALPIPGALYERSTGLLLSACGGTLLVLAAVFLAPARRALTGPLLTWHGRISYSFYLLHLPLLLIGLRALRPPVGLGQGLGLLALTALAATLGAALAYRGVERTAIRLGNAVCRDLARRSRAPVQTSRLLE